MKAISGFAIAGPVGFLESALEKLGARNLHSINVTRLRESLTLSIAQRRSCVCASAYDWPRQRCLRPARCSFGTHLSEFLHALAHGGNLFFVFGNSFDQRFEVAQELRIAKQRRECPR